MAKKVLILGAGYAGIETALTFQKRKRKSDDIKITLIDKNTYHTLLTELHEVAGNRIDEDGVIVPLQDIFKYTDVSLVRDDIGNVDFENRKLISESGFEYAYDYLVIAAGSEPNYFGIPGLRENSLPLWSYKDAVNVKEHIRNIFAKASQEKSVEKRKAMLTLIVGGGGFTGVEMIGELANWVKSLCREYSISRNEIRLMLIEALPNILNCLKPFNIAKAMDYLTKKLKVEVLLNSAITRVNSDSVELKDGTLIPSNTLIWTAGVRASGLTDEIQVNKGRASRIIVDEYNGTQHKNVYAIGDIAATPFGKSVLPSMVEGALQSGKNAAGNILAEIRGKEKEKLKPKLHGVIVSIGRSFAASDIMGIQFPRLISVLLKYMVNLHYLFGIGGFGLVIKYLKHDFLHKR